MRRKKENLKTLIAGTIVIVFFALIICAEKIGFLIFGISDEGKQPSSSPPEEWGTAPELNLDINKEFELIVFDNPSSMSGKSGYFDLKILQTINKAVLENTEYWPVEENGQKLITATGHQVYEEATGSRFIISGTDKISVVGGQIYPVSFLREEKSGIRIRTFSNQYAVDDFYRRYEEAQKILKHENPGEPNSVIMDGVLLDNKYVVINDDIYVNLYEVASQLNLNNALWDKTQGYLQIFVNDYKGAVKIPTNRVPYYFDDSFGIENGYFTFKSWNGPQFEAKIKILDEDTMLMRIKDMNIMFGWEFYTDGKTLSIVSDPLNVTDKAVVYNFYGVTSVGYNTEIIQDEDGSQMYIYKDPSGRVIWQERK